MDDLASEGLLLIRVLPSKQGRYGFIVKVSGCGLLRGCGLGSGCDLVRPTTVDPC